VHALLISRARRVVALPCAQVSISATAARLSHNPRAQRASPPDAACGYLFFSELAE
jgi:hypothetical protein